MTRILLILLLALTFFQCEGDSKGMKAFLHKNGTAVEHRLSRADQKTAMTLLRKLFAGTNDMLRVHVSEDLVEGIRKGEVALEFQFDEPTEFASPAQGTYSLQRLLFPMTGDYAGSAQDPVVTVFMANDQGFITGPLCSPNGHPDLISLNDLVSRLPPAK